ncbi:glycosyltransferase family 4 protein [Proteiniphilum sp. UBA5384]|uniref:glycosyltransferase family 4 protein n=1 Tax=Proteiniphilum sp. UBA5384 TaxID=1947279 RepID=UPI0025F1E3F8|nr:glycosyltransferase family 4 protein [Proteiniphilum sp. UBA5384]
MKRIVFVVNIDWFFLSHRLPLAVEAIKRGYDVYLLTANSGKRAEVEGYGIKFIEIPFERSGRNLLHEWRCVRILSKYYKQLKPDIIHHVTLKAALLGSIAAKISGYTDVVNAISGLGYNFTDGRNGLLQKFILFMMRKSFKSDHFYFILQNPDDIEMMKSQDYVSENHYKLIKGSGVDLKKFQFTPPLKNDKIHILFPARILYDKGVMELIEAAKRLEKNWKGKIIFVLAGDCDENNKAVIHEEYLLKHLVPDYIEWIGFSKNMISLYQQSDIVVLPSYREGLPKSLIEACAIGRPIITTDVPGCRECVVEGYNGLLVPAKTVEPLANTIEVLCGDYSLRMLMGKNSRALAEKEFSIESVIEKTFDIYEEIFMEY